MNPIVEILMDCPWLNRRTKQGLLEHYGPGKILKADLSLIRLIFIVGERRIGKTLLFQWVMCELYLRTGYATVWVRNKKVELEDDGFTSGFLNACHDMGWCPDDWVCNARGVQDAEGNDVCLFQSISTFSNRRGNRTSNVLMLVFDEFMPEDRRYPKSCCKGLMSLIKTMMAERPESMAFCLSNFISGGNPYFVGFRVFPSKKDITVFPDKGILIEVCRGYQPSIMQSNPWNAVFKAGRYQDYANADEDKMMELVERPPKGSKGLSWVLISDEVAYRAYQKDGTQYWAEYHGPLKGLYMYTGNREECGKGIMMLTKAMERGLREWFELDIMRYQNPNVMFAVLSVIFETV